MFPGEVYNPNSSPSRVRVLVNRLRKFLETHGCPLKIENDYGTYRLAILGSINIVIGDEIIHRKNSGLKAELKRLSKYIDKESFDTKDLQNVLNLSVRQSQRKMKLFCENGLVKEVESGRQRRYKIDEAA